MERWRSEQRFHDEQAAQRARSLTPADYVFRDEVYLRHESWIAPAFTMLGDVRGLPVLDLGCGHGMASVVLARRGAHVTACDLSAGYVGEAHCRATANDVRIQLVVCNGEALPFADGAFARIWGNAVLHHLDMRKAARQLHRVLMPGGVAVFCEPWAGNRWLNWARSGLPYPGKGRTTDEHPLSYRDVRVLQEQFPEMRVHGFQFLSMIGRVIGPGALARRLVHLDEMLLGRLPHWRNYCRYVVLELRK